MSDIIVVDHSRIEDTEHCMRKRYYGYHYAGVGLDRVGLSLDLSVGTTTHAILAKLLVMLSARTYSDERLAGIISTELLAWEADVRRRGLELELSSGYEQAEDGTIIVQAPSIDFTIALYSTWMRNAVTAWAAVRAPYFVQNYEIVTVEQEEEMYMADGQILFLSRHDALLKRYSDGEYFILNFKTVGEANGWWQEQWRHDMQTLSEVLPVEARLGQRVSGVLIEGLIKGSKRVQYPKDSGQWWLTSPFCWVWTKEAAPPFPAEYAASYEWTDEDGRSRRLGKGFNRKPSWEVMPPREWLQWLFEHERELVERQFVGLPPILRQDAECEQWVRQTTYREQQIAASIEALNSPSIQGAQEWLDAFFPMSTSGGHCIRPTKCRFFSICWGTAGVAPLENGYQLRIPNHPKEVELLHAGGDNATDTDAQGGLSEVAAPADGRDSNL